MDKPFSVLYWCSHPDAGNDDCTTGEDFDSRDEALAAFQQDPNQRIGWLESSSVAWLEIDGLEDSELKALGLSRYRKNPEYKPSKDDDREWQREIANEAGMLHGVDAYNEAMGWD